MENDERKLRLIAQMAEVVSAFVQAYAAPTAEAQHDLIDEVGARAHRIIDSKERRNETL